MSKLFWDIETAISGSFSSAGRDPIVMISVAIDDKEPEIHTWLDSENTIKYDSEKDMIESFIDMLDTYSLNVSFNGFRFDIPYLKKRAELLSLKSDYSSTSVDLYPLSKHVYPYLTNFKLDTISKYLLGEGKNDMDFEEYKIIINQAMNKKQVKGLASIIDYARQDCVLLQKISKFILKYGYDTKLKIYPKLKSIPGYYKNVSFIQATSSPYDKQPSMKESDIAQLGWIRFIENSPNPYISIMCLNDKYWIGLNDKKELITWKIKPECIFEETFYKVFLQEAMTKDLEFAYSETVSILDYPDEDNLITKDGIIYDDLSIYYKIVRKNLMLD